MTIACPVRGTVVFATLLLSACSFAADLKPAEDTFTYFAPKIALTDLRFVYTFETGLFMELSNEQRMLLDTFLRKYPDVNPATHVIWDAKGVHLNKEQQRFVFDRISEKKGDAYAVYDPDRRATALYRVSEIVPKPTGDGGFRGFLAKLVPNDHHVKHSISDCNWSKPVLLAFRSNKIVAQPERMDSLVSDEALFAKLNKAFSTLPAFKDQKIRSCTKIVLEYPNRIGYLVQIQATLSTKDWETPSKPGEVFHPTYLFCLEPTSDAALIIPFDGDDSRIEYANLGGLMTDINDGPCCDTTPVNTHIHVLPDMDGDSCCELLVVSTVTQLFQIDLYAGTSPTHHGSVIRLVADTYFGP